jgi:Tfp pilus assembly protein PilF
MSLIVSRKNNEGVYVVGDTKLTMVDDEHDYNLPKDFVIKSRLINKDVCVSFAGNVYFADEAFKQISDLSDINEICNILLDFNKSSQNGTDFIVSIGKPDFKIFEIKNCKISDVQTAWIGSQQGFNLFQKALHGEYTPITQPGNTAGMRMIRMPTNNSGETSLFGALYEAMKIVIEEESIHDIGGFVVPVAYFEETFQYMDYVNIFNHRIDFEELTKGTNSWKTVPFGTAQEGGYCLNFFSSQKKLTDIVGIHFLQGEFGVIYQSQDSGILRPKVYPEYDEIDFIEKIIPQYDIKPGLLAGHGSNRFFNKGLSEFKNRNILKALEYLYRAIEIDSQEWGKEFNKNNKFRSFNDYMDKTGENQIHIKDGRPDLNFTKTVFFFIGECHLNLNDKKKAIHYFSHTLQIDSSNFDALNRRAFCYFEGKDYPKAIPDLTKLIEIQKHEGLFLNRGMCYKNLGEKEKAISDFNEALELNPNFERARIERRLIE